MKKFFGVTVTLIITLYLLIEFIGDRLIKNILQNNISSALNREVSIENLNIDYLSGEANAKGISLLNKNFEGFFVKIENVKVELDAFSIFSNDVIINNVLLDDIKVNYYFKFADQSYDDAFSKLVALETLNKDKDHIIYYIVNMKSLWTKNQNDKINNEIKTAQETEQQELF